MSGVDNQYVKQKSSQVKTIGGIDFIKIAGGSFKMGSPDSEGGICEHPQHRVAVSGFLMGKYVVTQKQYTEVMGTNPSGFKSDDLPVEHVSWDEAMEFCKRFGEKYNVKARLPYEAEWEYACRAGTDTAYYWGNTIKDEYCWYHNNSGNRTCPAGTKKPNAWGLYDMSGNVWEWCMDWYSNNYYENSPDKDPSGPENGNTRSVRGGSWGSYDVGLRSANRYKEKPQGRIPNLGFRLVVPES